MRGRRAGWVVSAIVLVLLSFAMHSRPDHATFSLVEVETARTVDFDSGAVWLLLLGSDAREGRTSPRPCGRDPARRRRLRGRHGRGVRGAARLVGRHPGPRDGAHQRRSDARGTRPDGEARRRPVRNRTRLRGHDRYRGPGRPRRRGRWHRDRRPEEITVPRTSTCPRPTWTIPRGRSRARRRGGCRVRPGPLPARAWRLRPVREPPGDDARRRPPAGAHQDDVGFVEASVLRALGILDTNLGAAELYRLTQAVAQSRPRRQ